MPCARCTKVKDHCEYTSPGRFAPQPSTQLQQHNRYDKEHALKKRRLTIDTSTSPVQSEDAESSLMGLSASGAHRSLSSSTPYPKRQQPEEAKRRRQIEEEQQSALHLHHHQQEHEHEQQRHHYQHQEYQQEPTLLRQNVLKRPRQLDHGYDHVYEQQNQQYQQHYQPSLKHPQQQPTEADHTQPLQYCDATDVASLSAYAAVDSSVPALDSNAASTSEDEEYQTEVATRMLWADARIGELKHAVHSGVGLKVSLRVQFEPSTQPKHTHTRTH